MGYHALDTEFDYAFAKVIPKDHPKYINFQEFKKKFGEGGNTLVVSTKTGDHFKKSFFNDWYQLGNELKEIEGVQEVLSVPHCYRLVKNQEEERFDIEPLLQGKVSSKAEMDSIRNLFMDLPFYHGLVYNKTTKATLMALTLNKEVSTDKQVEMVETIKAKGEAVAEQHGIDIHYSGLPFIQSYKVSTISTEIFLFLFLASFFIIVILIVLFRSLYAVLFPALVVGIGVVWALGAITLLSYKITILTALIPNLILVIGIPNCVYLLNKYHAEFKKHGNKVRALTRMIERIGYVTLFANLTTAIGFAVFIFTEVTILKEFGIVAGLMITATFLISLITIPIVFSYLPQPKEKQMMHLDRQFFKGFLDFTTHVSAHYRKLVYSVTILVIIGSLAGITMLEARGYILDDIPRDSKIYKDLQFLERNFDGVMPFEILIDTKKEGAANQLSLLKDIDAFQDTLAKEAIFSKPMSIVNGLKFATQAYYNGNPDHYRLPRQSMTTPEMSFVQSYLQNTSGQEQGGQSLVNAFVDTNKQVTRISVKMADIGSHKLDDLYANLRPKVNSVFDTSQVDVMFTGTSVVVLEGFRFLIKGLINSVAIAFVLISIIMAYLFRSLRMLVLSLFPNLIPLMFTGGLMGFFDIPLKPSTVLVFSIAFGISVDYTIHFLAKYRLELNRHSWDIGKTVSMAIKETGISMTYTSLILFSGFITFTASSFGGNMYMGLLTSITLIVALFTNLILLPCLLRTFGGFMTRKMEKITEKKGRKHKPRYYGVDDIE